MGAGRGFEKRRGRCEMFVVPMFSRNGALGDWAFEVDCRFRKFDSWPLRGIFDKMISMLKKSTKPKDREPVCLIGRKRYRQKGEAISWKYMVELVIW